MDSHWNDTILKKFPFENQEKGFDVIVGNPPYVRQEEIKGLKESLKKKYEIFVSTADLYTYFYEHGVNLLRDNGILGYISSNKFMRAKYGSQLRNFLKHKTSLRITMEECSSGR